MTEEKVITYAYRNDDNERVHGEIHFTSDEELLCCTLDMILDVLGGNTDRQERRSIRQQARAIQRHLDRRLRRRQKKKR